MNCQILNQKIWEKHYTRKKARLQYPDETVVRYFTKYKAINPKAVVLDLGTGSGRHLKFLKKTGFQAYGCDYAITALRGLFPVVQAKAYELPFLDNFFDVVLCWGVVHYLEKDQVELLFREVYRILKTGGTFLLTIRAKEDTHLAKQVKEGDLVGSTVWLYSRKEAEKLFFLFSKLKYGYLCRIPLGEKKRIAHHVFEAEK